MSPPKLSNDKLRNLNLSTLNKTQKEYVLQRLANVPISEIAAKHGVTKQAVYKTLWKLSESDNSNYSQLSAPQKNCLYKNFVFECKVRKISFMKIARAVGISPSVLSSYIYGRSPLPSKIAQSIKNIFFPDISVAELFKQSSDFSL